MKKINNKKGFTLVELLAVIVILAVVMLIAVTAVGPLMEKSKKGALGSEGLGAADAAKLAYQAEQMSNSSFPSGQDVCFSLQWLCSNNYFEKGCSGDGYSGSVYVDADSTGGFTYTFWISNGTYATKEGVLTSSYSIDSIEASSSAASANCNGKTVYGSAS